MLALLRAVNLNYPILLMDEPFSNIDKDTKAIILAFLKDHLNQIVLQVTHDQRAENLANYQHIIHINQGQARQNT